FPIVSLSSPCRISSTFFFSSRRRHTRWPRDWSSDVCSSDLLILAWVAAVIALTAVALVGWSLIDLSERRIRFVSAVTHELRTPRSEERRVGKECRSRWSPDHLKKKTMKLHWRRWY